MTPSAARLTLSPRLTDIVDGISRGESYKEIGARLHISPHTVRTYVVRIAQQIEEFTELPPRWRILAYAKALDWSRSHAAVPKV